ncbi:MAG: hypothetical protein ACKN82_21470, partial [Pirellula sp.]
MKSLLNYILVILLAVATSLNSYADLVAGWDFQTTDNGGTAVLGAPNTPKQFVANFGSGTLFLNGQNGASDWVSAASNTELNGFSGTAVN